MRHRSSTCKWMLFFSILLLSAGCNKEHANLGSVPVIESPREGSVFFIGEAVRLRAEVEPGSDFNHMKIFLDDVFLYETNQQAFDTLLPAQLFSGGSHVLRVDVFDAVNGTTTGEVSFLFEEALKESKDTESFNDDQIDAWVLYGWSPADISADKDQSSIRSSTDHAVAITRKSFTESGSICFYVKNGNENMKFLVDGELKTKWFAKEDWGYYAYSVPEGNHIFRWECETEDTYLDHVTFIPGLEQHTPGEVYGGGTIFYLDSTGLHGLIAAFQDGKYDGNYEIPWGCYGLNILSGNRVQSNTNGEGNTWAIVQDCGLEKIAARYCFNLTTFHDDTIQDDWYLPAIMELNKLYLNRDMLEGLGGQYYWSSTSTTSSGARVISFMDGSHHGAHRNIPNITGPSTAAIYVRPIRKF